MRLLSTTAISALLLLTSACADDEERGEPTPVPLGTNAAEQALNSLVRASYPTGRSAALPAGTEPGAGRSAAVLQPGQTLRVAPPEPGAELCVAFGDPGNGWCVPVADAPAGALELPIPAGFCDGIDIGDVCHDIVCYESSTLDGVTYTQSSVQPLIAACGGCEDPSCASLIESGVCECATSADCPAGQSCDGGVCVVEGVLRFSARWDTQLDIDLHVLDPAGSELAYNSSSVPSGGVLDNDDTSGGPGTVENAAWATAAPAGTYTYWVRNYGGGEAGTITLSVFKAGVRESVESVTVGVGSGEDSARYTYDYAP